MKTVEEAFRDDERAKIGRLSQIELCENVLNKERDGWDISEQNSLYIAEISKREYSIKNCSLALGFTSMGTIDQPEISDSANQQQQSNRVDTDFPVGQISNPKLGYANLRDKPGSGSHIIGRLPNGTSARLETQS